MPKFKEEDILLFKDSSGLKCRVIEVNNNTYKLIRIGKFKSDEVIERDFWFIEGCFDLCRKKNHPLTNIFE